MKHTLIDGSIDPKITPIFGHKLELNDKFGRVFPYLRLSITEMCNFSCDYCLPNGYKSTKFSNFLQLPEIKNIVRAFAELGTHKVRITGGEPTLRKDFTDIIRTISTTENVDKVALTTNGYKLQENIAKWRDAGLTALNVSVDSLNNNRFHKLTGHNRLPEVLSGIDTAFSAGFEIIKINAVLLKDVNDIELNLFLEWVKNNPLSVRFIELMQTKDNLAYFNKFHISATNLQNKLLQQGWSIKKTAPDSGPAVELAHPDYLGSIGIIAPYSKDFCKGCNRLRVTSKGNLRLCLFGNQGTPLRHLLQHEQQLDELKQTIIQQLNFKQSSHFLALGDAGSTVNLSTIGG